VCLVRIYAGEFKFGLLSVEGNERRRREQARRQSLQVESGVQQLRENGEADKDKIEKPQAMPSALQEESQDKEAQKRLREEEEAKRAEEEEKRRQEERNREEERRRLEQEKEKEELERRLLLEKEEKMVQEEAKRLGEELAWRRKQRELARKKTKGKEGRQEKKKKEAMPKQLTQTECGANENAEGNESSVEEPEHPEEKSKDDNKTIPRAGQGTDPSPKAALGQTDAGVALQEDPSSEKESWQESDESVKELHRVEKMLRENKPAQARREGTIEETSGRWDVDSLLDELDETELGRFEHMLTICEGNQQNGTSSSFPPSTLSQQGESESSYHVDEALRFCVEIDAVLADAESVHADSPLGSLAESPNIENIKSRLCASPIKESLLLHLHQKRIERERQGSPRERSLMKQHSSSETKQAGVAPSVPASTFTKENTANNFRRSKRSSSMLSSTLEDKKSMNQLNMSLCVSLPWPHSA